jgi:HlyD family secretion protein
MKKKTIVVVISITGICLTLLAVITAVRLDNRRGPGAEVLTGMVESAEVDIAAKIPGRIDTLFVGEGATVSAGDTLVVLESRELDAKAEQAKASLRAANAKLTMADNGLRPQEINAAEKVFRQAKAQADLMEKTWKRVQKLAVDSVISNQELDQVEAQFLAAKEAMAATEAKLSLAREGSRAEDRDAAAALVSQAKQACNEANAWREEKVLVCPINGEVAKQIMRRGEIVGAGAPILTVVDVNDAWVVVTVKENDLSRFRMGAVFMSHIPALGDSAVELTVRYIAPMGEFATWRPTNQKGGFDLKTFEVHLRPKTPVAGLRAGMSANIVL